MFADNGLTRNPGGFCRRACATWKRNHPRFFFRIHDPVKSVGVLAILGLRLIPTSSGSNHWPVTFPTHILSTPRLFTLGLQH